MSVQMIREFHNYTWNARGNKARMVKYLNSTVEMLIRRQLDSKNQFTNTIAFIDSTLIAMESERDGKRTKII
jgi:hypothetical protein